MKKLVCLTVLILITTLILTSPTLTAQTCYQLYNKDEKLIWANSKPPFDLSAPPLSAEYQAARVRGERLLITQTNECGLPEELEAIRAQRAADADAKVNAAISIRESYESAKQQRRIKN